MDFNKLKTMDWLLIGGFVVLLIWAIQKGVFKKDKTYKTDPADAPDGSQPTMADNKYKNMAVAFRNAMLDNSTDASIFAAGVNSLLSLNDADLIKVSNAYGDLYATQEFNTLRSVLVQEWIIFFSSKDLKNKLLDRFNKIGI